MGWIWWGLATLFDYAVRPCLYLLGAGVVWQGLRELFWHSCARHVHKAEGTMGRIIGTSTIKAGFEQLVKETLSPLAINENDAVLDIGCGPGNAFQPLFEKFQAASKDGTIKNKVDAVDWSEEMLESVRDDFGQDLENFNITLHLCDMMKLPFPDASFHIVLALNVVHMVMDLHAFFAEVKRVLRPGGILVLSFAESTELLRTRYVECGVRKGLFKVRANTTILNEIRKAFTVEHVRQCPVEESYWSILARKK